MTDLDVFKEFFERMGVAAEESKTYPHGAPPARRATPRDARDSSSERILSVAQAHFHFDADGKYLGVEADEMGYFVSRGARQP